jgi:hypothetical protein
MTLNKLLQFVYENLNPILAAITIFSFIANIVQHKTNKNTRYILDTTYQTCLRTIRTNERQQKTNEELIHLIYIIRDQTVSALRSIGVQMSYGSYDQVNMRQGRIYRFLKTSYWLILIVKSKLPNIRQKNALPSTSTLDNPNLSPNRSEKKLRHMRRWQANGMTRAPNIARAQPHSSCAPGIAPDYAHHSYV